MKEIFSNPATYFFAFLLGCVVLVGCGPAKVESSVVNQQSAGGQRMKVVSSQLIVTTNGSHRDMMVLKDTETGKEYLLVQGFGAVEMVPKARPGSKNKP